MLEDDTGVSVDIPPECLTIKRANLPPKPKEKPVVKEKKKKQKVTVPQKKRKSTEDDEGGENVKRPRVMSVSSESEDEDGDEAKEETVPVSRLSVTGGFSWDSRVTVPLSSTKQDSSDSEDEDDNDDSKMTKTEKKKEKETEEKRLRQSEKEMLKSDRELKTSTDFDRLVLESPNSSVVWVSYMAFYLETAEIEKARAVAERALKTISFREEQEKLNVWMAFMNLENMYGSPEMLKAVIDRALQQNEPYNVYEQLIKMYVGCEKFDDAEKQYKHMIRLFSQRKEVWTNFALFYFKQEKPEDARRLLQRSLKSLDKRNHVDVIAKVAQMEMKHGEASRGVTMFENIVSNYPKRTDLWSIYVDMLVKHGDIDAARSLLERIISLKISTKKMKFFFKKYLDFETQYGDDDSVRLVKLKAAEYVEKKAAEISA